MRPGHLMIALALASVAGGAVAQPGGGPFGTFPPWNNQILWCDKPTLEAELPACDSHVAFLQISVDVATRGQPEEGKDWDPEELARHRAGQLALSQERARCQRIRTAISYLTANPRSVC